MRFKTPQTPHADQAEEERRARAFMRVDMPPANVISPLIRVDSEERPPSANKSSPGIPCRDYWVEDSLENMLKWACKMPNREADWPMGNHVHSTKIRHPIATRWSCEGLAETTKVDAILEPDRPPPAQLLRQEEAGGESLLRRMQRGTRPSNDGQDPVSGGKTFVVTADAILALNESISDVRDVLKLSCEYFKTVQWETTSTQPDPMELVGEERKKQSTMEVALPMPVRVRAPRAVSPEPKKSISTIRRCRRSIAIRWIGATSWACSKWPPIGTNGQRRKRRKSWRCP